MTGGKAMSNKREQAVSMAVKGGERPPWRLGRQDTAVLRVAGVAVAGYRISGFVARRGLGIFCGIC